MKHARDRRGAWAAAASAAALLTAVGVLVGGLFHDPAELLRRDAAAPDAVVDTVLWDDGDDGEPDDDGGGGDQERKRGPRKTLRQRILRLPFAVRLAVVFPLWWLGSGLLAAGGALWSGASPVLQGLLGLLASAALLCLGFAAAAKSVFPDVPLRRLLGRGTLPLLGLSALALAALDRVLAFAWADYPALRRAMLAGGFLLLLGGVTASWAVRERRRRLAAAAGKTAERLPAKAERVRFTDAGGDFSIHR